MTKTAEKPYPFGSHIPIKPIQGSIPRALTIAKIDIFSSTFEVLQTDISVRASGKVVA